jgi:hypothetical protein
MWQVVTIPSHQGGVTRIIKEKFQLRRFNVTVAKHHIGFAFVPGKRVPISYQFTKAPIHESEVTTPSDMMAIGDSFDASITFMRTPLNARTCVSQQAKCGGGIANPQDTISVVTVINCSYAPRGEVAIEVC